MKESNSKKRKLIIDAVIMTLITGVIALVIFALTYKRETHIYDMVVEDDTSALVCTSNSNDSETMFFSDNDATNVEHKIKLAYNNNRISKMSYEFTGEYLSSEVAEEAKGAFNTKYNIYIGDHNMNLNILSPIFQHVDNKAKVELYLDDYRKMNSAIGKLFYIGSASLDSMSKNSKEETKKYYEKKGFSCIIND